MTVKDFLTQYRAADLRIKAKLDQIAQLRTLASKCTQTLSGMPRGGGKDWTDISVKVMEMEQELIADMDQLHTIKRDVMAAIDEVQDSHQRIILEMRYVSGWGWSRIARETSYSVDWVWTIHRKALSAVKDNRKKQ